MSEADVLARAAAALRAAHDGQREGSGFTRARILDALGERRTRRPLRWLVVAPLASVLLVGSAWAQGTRSWPRVWQALASVLTLVAPSALPPVEKPHTAARPLPRTPEPAPPEAAPPLEVPPPEPPSAEPPAAPPSPKARGLAAPRPEPKPPRAERAPSLPADPELGTFRAAHELHVRGESRAALAAYSEYLRAYPLGRFVPEARYNGALDSIKLGDTAAARAALTPFAEGAHGGYRQREARELLQALPR
jgi:hypothetical protein